MGTSLPVATTAYESFLARKAQLDPPTGLIDLPALPAQLFPFQHDITRWALRRGRAAVFAQTGLGKSFIELSWGDAIHRATGGDILLLTPFMGIGSEVYCAVAAGRRGIGFELKDSYWLQAVANLRRQYDEAMHALLGDLWPVAA